MNYAYSLPAHFPTPPPASAFNAADPDSLTFSKIASKTSKKIKSVVAETDKIEYKGSLENTTDTSRFLVGVYSKKDNTLSLVDTKGIFQLHQKVKGFNEEDTDNSSIKTKRERKADLTKAFGSNKAKGNLKKYPWAHPQYTSCCLMNTLMHFTATANDINTTVEEVFDIAKDNIRTTTSTLQIDKGNQ